VYLFRQIEINDKTAFTKDDLLTLFLIYWKLIILSSLKMRFLSKELIDKYYYRILDCIQTAVFNSIILILVFICKTVSILWSSIGLYQWTPLLPSHITCFCSSLLPAKDIPLLIGSKCLF
jgi:L-asparagine transporter-like permease